MGHQFKKHYTVEEARLMLPKLRLWLGELNQHRKRVKQLDERLGQLLAGGADPGGELVNEWIKNLAGIQKRLAGFRASWTFNSRTWSAAWLISPPSWAARKSSSAGSRMRMTLSSGTTLTRVSPDASGCRRREELRRKT